MALVSREVASYPMQGAVERPPAPTLSPLPNPFLCLRLPDFLSLSLSRFAFLCLPTPPPRPYLCHTRLSFSLASTSSSPFARSLVRPSVRPSQANFHRSSSVLECVELPESHLPNQRWSLLGEPSLPPSPRSRRDISRAVVRSFERLCTRNSRR